MPKDEKLDTKRHSLAHIMAASIQEMFPEAKFGVGPVIEDGFYYDVYLSRTLTPEDLEQIERRMREKILFYLLAHAPLDLLQVLGRQRAAEINVVVETVLDDRTDAELRFRKHFLNAGSHDVRQRVTFRVEFFVFRHWNSLTMIEKRSSTLLWLAFVPCGLFREV